MAQWFVCCIYFDYVHQQVAGSILFGAFFFTEFFSLGLGLGRLGFSLGIQGFRDLGIRDQGLGIRDQDQGLGSGIFFLGRLGIRLGIRDQGIRLGGILFFLLSVQGQDMSRDMSGEGLSKGCLYLEGDVLQSEAKITNNNLGTVAQEYNTHGKPAVQGTRRENTKMMRHSRRNGKQKAGRASDSVV